MCIRDRGRLKAAIDLGGSLPSQVLATRLIDGAEEMRERCRRLIAERLDRTTALLHRHLPDWTWEQPAGGLCLWIRLPVGNSADFVAVARQHGVALVPGAVMSPSSGHLNFMRLPFAFDPAVSEDGISRLAAAWTAYAAVARPASRSLPCVV